MQIYTDMHSSGELISACNRLYFCLEYTHICAPVCSAYLHISDCIFLLHAHRFSSNLLFSCSRMQAHDDQDEQGPAREGRCRPGPGDRWLLLGGGLHRMRREGERGWAALGGAGGGMRRRKGRHPVPVCFAAPAELAQRRHLRPAAAGAARRRGASQRCRRSAIAARPASLRQWPLSGGHRLLRGRAARRGFTRRRKEGRTREVEEEEGSREGGGRGSSRKEGARGRQTRTREVSDNRIKRRTPGGIALASGEEGRAIMGEKCESDIVL
jgi:hypothetical protein